MAHKHNLPIKIELPDRYLDEEVRCGYKITVKQKKIWAIQLDIYDTIQNVCNRHGIKFCVYWGTLLGAIRHKGFIPWDDDFDICMDRENYDRFVSLPQEEFGYPYFLQTAITDRSYWLPIARVRNSLTTGAVVGMMSQDYNNGVYVDVYPMDGLLDNMVAKRIHRFFIHAAIQPVAAYHMKNFPIGINGILKRTIKPLARCLPYEFWYALFIKTLKFPTKWCDKLSTISEDSKEAMWSWMLKEEFKKMQEVPFEFLKVIAPYDWGEILSRIYGDFRRFPPIEKRGCWHEGQLILDPDIPYKEYFAKHGID